MTGLHTSHWKQWDDQQIRKMYCELNNLYLRIERGEEKITITSANHMRTLIAKIFPGDTRMQQWWLEELFELPGYFDV